MNQNMQIIEHMQIIGVMHILRKPGRGLGGVCQKLTFTWREGESDI